MTGDEPGEAVAQFGLSPRLRQRRFFLLPLRGEGTVFAEVQGRLPGDATAPAELADLISSISTVGVLQPVLVEEIPSRDGRAPAMKLAAGERRLRACRWGAVHRPDNPHFAALPAVVCPGPLSDEERRIWQLVENLARENLRPGELAAALVLDRCAVLLGKLLDGGHPVPADVYAIDDPIERFTAMERIRGNDRSCAAPWSEVLTRLGLQLTPRKARELVRAFAEMPRELAEEMDEAKISLHTRIRFIELRRGREAAAEEIWSAVKESGRTRLFSTALVHANDRELTAEQALSSAEETHQHADEARAAKLRAQPADEYVAEEKPQPVEQHLVDAALAALRALVHAVSSGRQLHEHDASSLRLLTDHLADNTGRTP